MADEAPGASQQPVAEPDNKQVQAPSDNNQPDNSGQQAPEDKGVVLDDDVVPKGSDTSDDTPEAIKQLLGDDDGTDDKGGDDNKGEQQPDESEANPDEAKRKQEARERYLERQIGKRDEVIDQLTEQLQSNYIDKAPDDNDKRIRSLEAKDFVTQIRDARSNLVSDNQRVATEIPIFNPSDPNYEVKGPNGLTPKDIHQRVLARYAVDNVILRPIELPDGSVSNEVVGTRQSLYDYMKEMADLIGFGVSSGAKSQERAAATMAANAETPGGGAPAATRSKSDKDPFIAGMDSVEV